MLLQEVGVGVTEMFSCACKPATWPLVMLVTHLCNVLKKKKKKELHVVYLLCDVVVAIRYTIIIGCYSGQCVFALLITVYVFTFYYAHVFAGIIDHSLLVPLGISMLGSASHSFGLSCASTVNGHCCCTDDLLQLAAVVYLSCDAVVAIRYTIIFGCYSEQCIFALLITVYVFSFYSAHVYAGIIDHSLLVPLGLSMMGPASHSASLDAVAVWMICYSWPQPQYPSPASVDQATIPLFRWISWFHSSIVIQTQPLQPTSWMV